MQYRFVYGFFFFSIDINLYNIQQEQRLDKCVSIDTIPQNVTKICWWFRTQRNIKYGTSKMYDRAGIVLRCNF